MSYDGFVTHSVVHELNTKILGGKIDKIYQPENDEIIITVRTFNGNYRLLLSASASNARVHFTDSKKENPMTPPMLCMLMRKHLSGGKIIGISQIEFDRIIKIDIESYNELGDLGTKSIIAEIMGRHSNIIFVDDTNKILDSAKHVDFTVSAVRQILPGFIYELPPKQDKLSPNDFDLLSFMNDFAKQDNDILLDKFLLSRIMGMSPLVARELVYRFCGHTKVTKGEIDEAKFVTFLDTFIADMLSNKYEPCIVYDNNSKPLSFSCIKLTQYEELSKIKSVSSISGAIDNYYLSRAMQESMHQKSSNILKLVQNNIDRCTKKIAMHRENLEKSKNREKYKIKGDLLTANMYRVKYGTDEITVQNFYDNNSDITIKLNPNISPSQNAQNFYKRYNKAKVTEKYAADQIKEAEEELSYLETVHDSILKAEAPRDLSEIRDELREQGYIPKSSAQNKKKKTQKSMPMKFISSDGYEILVGRNNKQNDELTVRMSYSTDIWLHTKEIPGSHTLIRTNGEGTAPDSTILEAAQLAAYYSKAKESAQVPVDYTQVKNVKKPNGSKPGFVIYERNNTVYVTPKLLEQKGNDNE